MTPPPKHRRGVPRTLDKCFAADPFDKRMHRNSPKREHTPLGLCLESYWWYRTHDIPPALVPVMNSTRELLERDCPDALAELERIA